MSTSTGNKRIFKTISGTLFNINNARKFFSGQQAFMTTSIRAYMKNKGNMIAEKKINVVGAGK